MIDQETREASPMSVFDYAIDEHFTLQADALRTLGGPERFSSAVDPRDRRGAGGVAIRTLLFVRGERRGHCCPFVRPMTGYCIPLASRLGLLYTFATIQ